MTLDLLFLLFVFFELRKTEISFHCLFFFPEAMFVFSDVAIYFSIPFLAKDVFKEKKALAVKTFS